MNAMTMAAMAGAKVIRHASERVGDVLSESRPRTNARLSAEAADFGVSESERVRFAASFEITPSDRRPQSEGGDGSATRPT